MNSTRCSVPVEGRRKRDGMVLFLKIGDKAPFQTLMNRTEPLSTFQINNLKKRLTVLNSKLIEPADHS